MLYCASEFHSFLLLNNLPLYEYATFCLFIQQFMFSFGIYLEVECLGQMVTMFSTWRNCHTVFQNGCTFWPPHQHYMKIPISPILFVLYSNTICISSFPFKAFQWKPSLPPEQCIVEERHSGCGVLKQACPWKRAGLASRAGPPTKLCVLLVTQPLWAGLLSWDLKWDLMIEITGK